MAGWIHRSLAARLSACVLAVSGLSACETLDELGGLDAQSVLLAAQLRNLDVASLNNEGMRALFQVSRNALGLVKDVRPQTCREMVSGDLNKLELAEALIKTGDYSRLQTIVANQETDRPQPTFNVAEYGATLAPIVATLQRQDPLAVADAFLGQGQVADQRLCGLGEDFFQLMLDLPGEQGPTFYRTLVVRAAG